jgi:hypothetical protein
MKEKLKFKIFRTVILLDALYGCETLSLALREERSLMALEKRVSRRIFEPKREKNESWRKLHNGELHSLYSLPTIVRLIKLRRMKWAGHMSRIEEGRSV